MTHPIITAEEAKAMRERHAEGLAILLAAGAPDKVTHAPQRVVHLCQTIEALHAEVEALRDRAIRFDLDQAGIEQREAEAVELVELRDDKKILSYLHRELSDLFGWGNESVLHAVAHVRNAVLNLRADLATEKFLKDNAERLVRNDIVDLLEEKAELCAEETEWVSPASVWDEAVELVRWKDAPKEAE